MYEQSKWHEAQPSASDEASALLLLSNLGRKHILMARSEAEGILPINNTPFYTAKGFKSIKYSIMHRNSVMHNNSAG